MKTPLVAVAMPSLLLLINIYITARFFICEYIPQMQSIEAAYIALTRYILENPTDLGWFHLWYTGVPFENTYPPLLHIVSAVTAVVGDVSPARAHHMTVGAMYCFGPLSVYLLAFRLSASHLKAGVAGLLYSTLSPSAFFIPHLAETLGTPLGMWKLLTLSDYGDGPHVMAVTLLPLALVAIDRALERPRSHRVYVAALATAAVVLTNWLGAFSLALGVLVLLATRQETTTLRPWRIVSAIGVIAYCLASPWVPPSNIRDIAHNARHTVGQYPMGTTHFVIALIVGSIAVLGIYAVRRFRWSRLLQFAAVYAIGIGSLPLIQEWCGIHLMPQSNRYVLEMDIALVLVGAGILVKFITRLPKLAAVTLVVLGLIGAVNQILLHRHKVRGMVRPFDITHTVEYEAANWLQANLPGKRVFATGSIQFWLNVFSDNPQVGGGFEQGITNRTIPMVHFGVPFTKGNPEECADWLRAYGAEAVVVSGPGSREAYPQNFRDAPKFQGVFRELWRSGDDVIYEVPDVADGLVHVVRAENVVQQTPRGFDDTKPLQAYLGALGDRSLPPVHIEWKTSRCARLSGELGDDHLVSVQISHRPGWSAEVEGRKIEVQRDGLGFIVLKPECSGPCEIDLQYDGGMERRFTILLMALSLIGGIAWVGLENRASRGG